MIDPTELAPLVRREMDPGTASRELRHIRRRHRDRQVRLGVVVAAVLVAAVAWITRTDSRPPDLRLPDGVAVHARSADLDVRVLSTSAGTAVEVTTGEGLFVVPANAQLTVRLTDVQVEAGPGARFIVRRDDDGAALDVLAGTLWQAGDEAPIALTGRHRFPIAPAVVPTPPAAVAPRSVAPPSVTQPRSAQPPSAQPDRAAVHPSAPPPRRVVPRSTRPAPPKAPSVTAASLMAAADAARSAGDRAGARRHLEALLRQFPRHTQAPTAAFTLGRIASNAQASAEAFERAFRLAPTGPLALDALTRAAVKWQAAGDHARARRLAQQAAERAPDARHMRRLAPILTP